MKSPEESDLYIITPLRYNCTAKSLDRIKQQMSKATAVCC